MQFGQPIIVKPAKGLKVRKENGTFLPDAGDTVVHSSYWARREQDGDVTLSEIKAAKAKQE